MSDSERRSILSQVAEGTLSPDEAAERLAALDPKTHDHTNSGHTNSGHTNSGSEGPGGAAAGRDRGLPPGEPAKRLRIVGSVRMIEIIGDPAVAEAVAEGPHDARREGDLLVIEGEGPDVSWNQPGWRWNWNWTGDEADESDDDRPRGNRGAGAFYDYDVDFGRFSRRGKGRVRGPIVAGFGPGAKRVPALKVRVNPALPLEIGVKAGSMSVSGVDAPITAECDAASLQIKGFTAPLQARVNAGKFEASGVMAAGHSSIEANAAKVDIRLHPSSSVTIKARAELGRVNLPGSDSKSGRLLGSGSLLGSEHESVLGGGAASLDMEVNVGAANVSLDDGS